MRLRAHSILQSVDAFSCFSVSRRSLRTLPVLIAPRPAGRLSEVVVAVGVIVQIGEVTPDRGWSDGGSRAPDVLVFGQPGRPFSLLPTLLLLLTTHAHAAARHRREERHRARAAAGRSLRGPARWSDKPATRHRWGRRSAGEARQSARGSRPSGPGQHMVGEPARERGSATCTTNAA